MYLALYLTVNSHGQPIALAITKAKRGLSALKLIRRFLSGKQILQLVMSNVYSVLFYNSEIWHIPSLKQNLKQKLLSMLASALKICMNYNDPMMSVDRLHEINKRATPEKMMLYKHALLSSFGGLVG